MATCGYKVYRWRGWYFVYYNHFDSYPRGLGLQFLATIPKDSKSFQGWLAKMRQHFDEIIEVHNKSELDEDDENDVTTMTITKEVPSNDLFIKWIYTIDL
ncbi:hypothetical protein EDB86DRAFT_2886612, partial [Lactarius hatsudake]